jgi:5-formyltetrahydrofolate cyclo-ligase
MYPEKNWVLPRILPDHGLRFHPYDPQRLVFHSFGMAEPDPELPAVPAQEIELVLVPGLAFDRRGWRLGYGGGYFDRFLKECRGTSLGVTYEALLLENLPRDEHDMPMQWIVTEKKISPAKS